MKKLNNTDSTGTNASINEEKSHILKEADAQAEKDPNRIKTINEWDSLDDL